MKLDHSTLSAKVRSHRASLDLTQAEAARAIGISTTTLSYVENGNSITLSTYLKLCAWLGTPAPYTIYLAEKE